MFVTCGLAHEYLIKLAYLVSLIMIKLLTSATTHPKKLYKNPQHTGGKTIQNYSIVTDLIKFVTINDGNRTFSIS